MPFLHKLFIFASIEILSEYAFLEMKYMQKESLRIVG